MCSVVFQCHFLHIACTFRNEFPHTILIHNSTRYILHVFHMNVSNTHIHTHTHTLTHSWLREQHAVPGAINVLFAPSLLSRIKLCTRNPLLEAVPSTNELSTTSPSPLSASHEGQPLLTSTPSHSGLCLLQPLLCHSLSFLFCLIFNILLSLLLSSLLPPPFLSLSLFLFLSSHQRQRPPTRGHQCW